MTGIIINYKIKLIKFYKYLLSPLLGNNCRYYISCSEYYIDSLKKYGLLKGSFFGIKRILTCHPFKIFGGGSDYEYFHNENKKNSEK
jgi:putative membrane protein insertion efficiency factor